MSKVNDFVSFCEFYLRNDDPEITREIEMLMERWMKKQKGNPKESENTDLKESENTDSKTIEYYIALGMYLESVLCEEKEFPVEK